MLYSALLMGLAGSLHCAVMCGPLVLAVPVAGNSREALLLSRIIYHAGRIATYALLGVLFGLIGKSLFLAGLQQWVSMAVGIGLLLFLVLGACGVRNPLVRSPLIFRKLFGRFLVRRSYPSTLILGALNGLLPCGLVYMAGTASAATGSISAAALYMTVFGLGTLPVLLLMGACRNGILRTVNRLRPLPVAPIAVSLVAVILIVRGAGLGVPYLSPAKSAAGVTCPVCSAH